MFHASVSRGWLQCLLIGSASSSPTWWSDNSAPIVIDKQHDITYSGFVRNSLDVFLNIKYGEDTSGQNRFKPPLPYLPPPGTVVQALSYGPACIQELDTTTGPISLTNTSVASEDCLNLNVYRPPGLSPGDDIPVLIWIYGGSFWDGDSREITTMGDGLILQSIENETPIIHVSLNYRLGVFGFAFTEALLQEGSTNAGLRDQRLAIEWVRDNIQHFGGDPNQITIHGQSSGGLAVGMQTVAYGGTKPVAFHRAICESQALENGITGTFTVRATKRVVDTSGCNSTGFDSAATIACLRNLDVDTLAQASFDTFSDAADENTGDIWLPHVDNDFLPDKPSTLMAQGRFANIPTMILWAENDMQPYTPMTIVTPNDTLDFFTVLSPDMTAAATAEMLALYPSDTFQANVTANLSSEYYRASQIYRDILMTCQPIYYGQQLAAYGNPVWYLHQNQTLLSRILDFLDQPGYGVIHTSEFPYTFGNLSHYNVSDYPFDPSAEDYRLEKQMAGTWASFASQGTPSIEGKATLQGMELAYDVQKWGEGQTAIFVVGGDAEGMSTFDGPLATDAVRMQRLRERCGFLNRADIVAMLQF